MCLPSTQHRHLHKVEILVSVPGPIIVRVSRLLYIKDCISSPHGRYSHRALNVFDDGQYTSHMQTLRVDDLDS